MAEITHRFDVDKPLREGYLFKEGGSTKSWHKRYFALYPGVLVYYYKFSYYKKDREKGNLKHKINEISLEQCSTTTTDWQPRPHMFVLHTCTEETRNKRNRYVLSARSAEDKDLWIAALTRQSPVPGASETPELVKVDVGNRNTVSNSEDDEDSEFNEDDANPDHRHSVRTGTELTYELIAAHTAAATLSDEDNDIPGYAKVIKTKAATIPFSRDSVVDVEFDVESIHEGTTSVQSAIRKVDIEVESDTSTTDVDSQDEIQIATDTATSSESEEDEPCPKEQCQQIQRHAIVEDETDSRHCQESYHLSNTDSKLVPIVTNDNSVIIEDSVVSTNTSQASELNSIPLQREEYAANTVVIEGILQKQGGRYKSWKVRYFRVFPGLLRYYANKDTAVCLHEVKLDGARVLIGPTEQTRWPYHFTLQTKSYWNKRSDYVMAASSESERQDWITALKRASKMKKKAEFGNYDDKRGRSGLTSSPAHSPKQSPRLDRKVIASPSQTYQSHLVASFSPVSLAPVVCKDTVNVASTKVAASPVLSVKSSSSHPHGQDMSAATASLKAAAAYHDSSDLRKEFTGAKVDLYAPDKSKGWPPLSTMKLRSIDETAERQLKEKKQHSKPNLRHLVSKQKQRYLDNEFDLDLTYVSDKIIAMGFPSEGAQSVYRNKLADVQRLLDAKHKGHYKLYNLCSERAYPANKFYNRVASYPFDDHCAPTLPLVSAFCEDVHLWLTLHQDNVAVVHCKAGKGRTGCLISAYLLHVGAFSTAEDALAYFGETRTYNKKGVTIPSQKRYVKYYEDCLRLGIPTTQQVPRQLEKIRMFTVPNVDSLGGCNPYYIIYENNELKYTSKKPDQGVDKEKGNRIVIHNCDVQLTGDVQLQLWDYDRFQNGKHLCSIFFNSMFIDENNKLFLKRPEIDRACKKKRKEFSDDFCLELVFHEITQAKSQ